MKHPLPPFLDWRRSEILRMVRWGCRLLLRLIGEIKDALIDMKVNTGIAISLLGKVCWLIPLIVVPHLFLTFPAYYREFAKGGPEWGWSLWILALISLDAAALMRKKYSLQMTTLGVGTLMWFFLGSMVAEGSPRGYFGLWGTPGSYMYGMAAIGCLAGIVYTGQKHRAAQNADDLLVWRQFVEEELERDAKWTQPPQRFENKPADKKHFENKGFENKGFENPRLEAQGQSL